METPDQQATWASVRQAMARGDALGWLRGRMSRPMPPAALFAMIGADRRGLVAELRRAARPEAEAAVEEVEGFFDAVHAAACAASRPAGTFGSGPLVWPWAEPAEPPPPLAVPAGALALLHDTGRRLLAELDLRRLLPLLVDRAAAITRADVVALAVWDPEANGLVVAESRGLPLASAEPLPLAPGDRHALTRTPGARVVTLAEAAWLAPALRGTDLDPLLIAPLDHAGALWGVLVCGGGGFDAADGVRVDLTSVLAGQVAIAVRNAALFREALGAASLLRDANERLRGLDVLKDHFLATVSHELRTPLTWITGFGTLLVEEPGLTTEHRYYVQKMLEGAFQLLALVNDLLDYSRMHEGRLPLHREVFAPAAVTLALLEQHAPVARRNGLTLLGDLTEGLPSLYGDPYRVGQVLGNLVSNALKFTPAGGRVAMRVRPATGAVPAVRFEVEDTGPGIARADQGRLFERFSRLEQDPTRRTPGTGLGLAISRGLVEAHGGEIGVTSPAPDATGGCLFWFELPVTAPVGEADG